MYACNLTRRLGPCRSALPHRPSHPHPIPFHPNLPILLPPIPPPHPTTNSLPHLTLTHVLFSFFSVYTPSLLHPVSLVLSLKLADYVCQVAVNVATCMRTYVHTPFPGRTRAHLYTNTYILSLNNTTYILTCPYSYSTYGSVRMVMSNDPHVRSGETKASHV